MAAIAATLHMSICIVHWVSERVEIIEEYARMLIAFTSRYHSMKLNYFLASSVPTDNHYMLSVCMRA